LHSDEAHELQLKLVPHTEQETQNFCFCLLLMMTILSTIFCFLGELTAIMAHKDVVLVAFFLPQQNFKMKSLYINAAVSYCRSASLLLLLLLALHFRTAWSF
jgi:hypothetical protein